MPWMAMKQRVSILKNIFKHCRKDAKPILELTTRKPAVKDDCENRILINDGVCDEVANIADCLFDGGDCCLEDKDTKYCQDCECKSSDCIPFLA